MVSEDYQNFRFWLTQTNRIPLKKYLTNQNFHHEDISDEFDFVEMLFLHNRFVNRYISPGDDLFSLIKNKNYRALYDMRYHYRYKRNIAKYYFLLFCFEYLEENFTEFKEYEAVSCLAKYSNSQTLFIHKGNIACLMYKHPVEDVKASIITASDDPIFVHASHCTKCNITFIRKEEYLRLRKRYPFLVANFCELSEDGYTPVSSIRLAAESPLMLCGYNVKQGGPPKYYRQAILANMIYNGILSKTQIIQYLEHFISFNGHKESLFFATDKWESDLEYVRNLDIDSHPVVSISEIKPYSQRNK